MRQRQGAHSQPARALARECHARGIAAEDADARAQPLQCYDDIAQPCRRGGRMAPASARTQPLSNTHHTISIDHHLRHDAAPCKRATDTTQHATLNIQHATRNTQHATCNMQQTCNLPCATCNVVRHASCHGTTVHTQLAVSLSHRSSLRWRRTRVRAPYSRRSRAARACGVPESEPPLVRSL